MTTSVFIHKVLLSCHGNNWPIFILITSALKVFFYCVATFCSRLHKCVSGFRSNFEKVTTHTTTISTQQKFLQYSIRSYSLSPGGWNSLHLLYLFFSTNLFKQSNQLFLDPADVFNPQHRSNNRQQTVHPNPLLLKDLNIECLESPRWVFFSGLQLNSTCK